MADNKYVYAGCDVAVNSGGSVMAAIRRFCFSAETGRLWKWIFAWSRPRLASTYVGRYRVSNAHVVAAGLLPLLPARGGCRCRRCAKMSDWPTDTLHPRAKKWGKVDSFIH